MEFWCGRAVVEQFVRAIQFSVPSAIVCIAILIVHKCITHALSQFNGKRLRHRAQPYSSQLAIRVCWLLTAYSTMACAAYQLPDVLFHITERFERLLGNAGTSVLRVLFADLPFNEPQRLLTHRTCHIHTRALALTHSNTKGSSELEGDSMQQFGGRV